MAQHLLRVDHPSLSDLRRAVASKARGIAALKDNEFREIEQQLRARETDPDDVFVDPKDEANHKATLRTINALEQQHQFFQSYIQDQTYLLGSVFAGSGYWRTRARQDQRKDPTIADWALIEIPKERLGENIVSLFFYFRSAVINIKLTGDYDSHIPTRNLRSRVSNSEMEATSSTGNRIRKLDARRVLPRGYTLNLGKRISTMCGTRKAKSTMRPRR